METVRNNSDREELLHSDHSETGKPTKEKPVSEGLERLADEMAGRGRARQRQDEKGVIVESDGH
jgi:hypothetical protein